MTLRTSLILLAVAATGCTSAHVARPVVAAPPAPRSTAVTVAAWCAEAAPPLNQMLDTIRAANNDVTRWQVPLYANDLNEPIAAVTHQLTLPGPKDFVALLASIHGDAVKLRTDWRHGHADVGMSTLIDMRALADNCA